MEALRRVRGTEGAAEVDVAHVSSGVPRDTAAAWRNLKLRLQTEITMKKSTGFLAAVAAASLGLCVGTSATWAQSASTPSGCVGGQTAAGTMNNCASQQKQGASTNSNLNGNAAGPSSGFGTPGVSTGTASGTFGGSSTSGTSGPSTGRSNSH